jgi:hypothetical protein
MPLRLETLNPALSPSQKWKAQKLISLPPAGVCQGRAIGCIEDFAFRAAQEVQAAVLERFEFLSRRPAWQWSTV